MNLQGYSLSPSPPKVFRSSGIIVPRLILSNERKFCSSSSSLLQQARHGQHRQAIQASRHTQYSKTAINFKSRAKNYRFEKLTKSTSKMRINQIHQQQNQQFGQAFALHDQNVLLVHCGIGSDPGVVLVVVESVIAVASDEVGGLVGGLTVVGSFGINLHCLTPIEGPMSLHLWSGAMSKFESRHCSRVRVCSMETSPCTAG